MEQGRAKNLAELADQIIRELWQDQRVDLEHAAISFAAEDGQLRLEGEVPGLAAKRIVANISQQLAGDSTVVEDRLCLQADVASDADIARKVARYLSDEPEFRACSIAVHHDRESRIVQQHDRSDYRLHARVDQGVIRLTGDVGSHTHRRFAEVLCWWVPGCVRVDNWLEVRPYESDSDNLLTDAIRIVLEKDPFVDATQVRAATAAGIVELRGLLPTEEAHRHVVRDVWAVPGVWEVYDLTHTGQPTAANDGWSPRG
ncbi:BON domain-containing protein [Thioalkalivibrio sp. XN8]|uniref:BON domain-containing protein n=1 Tax=Thioalkalivibrio sp. XN8 TaxID=2712863 RepID=UPI0013ED3D87|nr:BON domain-containing protein [Thioalkalivibrio sp. XN8]NGP54492.1 BON domain-containing protein [Thioalkalivibrio sp. XN8]